MTIWKLEAVARPDDPRWQAGPRYERLYVRAGTPAEARICAGKALAPNPAVVGNENAEQPGPFEDAALYRVTRSSANDAGVAASEEGEPAVIAR
ncbi:hypothetical protein SAMN06265365_13025 [Tistlia consotensis]|uniref:Uncharacterized protein n=1 Tax=Tistlia consotensis USBA 355 TaxID=560819 RepID=A0A1Y6CT76_9PROT|nr:hypothetical protein [Tistlia consotensis]SMF72482.1 hypothetical protein SAMN05428998_13125 [Tistlia consotensis USBA 355]SNS09212.1 hypothetical protein SAMN06265365_13025 [Tistlia consotensis]